MAENKATALKEANNKYQLKVYYTGDTPADSGSKIIEQDILDGKHFPWLFKFYTSDKVCHQYGDLAGIYNKLSQDLNAILDAVIVNAKQREAVGKIVDNTLYEYLCRDFAHEDDIAAADFPMV